MGSAGNGPISICAQNGNGHRAGNPCGARGWRHRRAQDEDHRAGCRQRAGRIASKFLSGLRLAVDAGHHTFRLSRRELVGELVSGRRTGRRRLRRAAYLFRQR